MVDRAPYHLERMPDTPPAEYELWKAEQVRWLIQHEILPADSEAGLQQARTTAEMKAVGEKIKPTPRFSA